MTAMPARPNWTVWVLIGVVALAVVLGLVVTGGPAQGRREKRDELRLADLQVLMNRVQCRATETGALPADLSPTPPCAGDLRLDDPYTGTPYRYEILSPDSFRVCAAFETDLPLQTYWDRVNIDMAAGCLTGHLPRPAAAK